MIEKVAPNYGPRRLPLKELIALLVFTGVGGMFAMPCLCVQGAIAAKYKIILFVAVFLRLGWAMYKRRFRFSDYFIYFAVVVGFSIWTDPHF